MANLSSSTYQFIQQLGVTRLIDANSGPTGPTGVTSSLLVGANGWHNGTRLPHEVVEDLKAASLAKQVVEGVEYWLVPEVSSNLPGLLSHYAQKTGVADLQNPPGGGVNAARQHADAPAVTVDPEGVAKYVADVPEAFVEAQDLKTAKNDQVLDAVGHGTGSATSAPEAPAPAKAAKADKAEKSE